MESEVVYLVEEAFASNIKRGECETVAVCDNNNNERRGVDDRLSVEMDDDSNDSTDSTHSWSSRPQHSPRLITT
jgi:hypothetical protein